MLTRYDLMIITQIAIIIFRFTCILDRLSMIRSKTIPPDIIHIIIFIYVYTINIIIKLDDFKPFWGIQDWFRFWWHKIGNRDFVACILWSVCRIRSDCTLLPLAVLLILLCYFWSSSGCFTPMWSFAGFLWCSFSSKSIIVSHNYKFSFNIFRVFLVIWLSLQSLLSLALSLSRKFLLSLPELDWFSSPLVSST